jgi:hypothetical protein
VSLWGYVGRGLLYVLNVLFMPAFLFATEVRRSWDRLSPGQKRLKRRRCKFFFESCLTLLLVLVSPRGPALRAAAALFVRAFQLRHGSSLTLCLVS